VGSDHNNQRHHGQVIVIFALALVAIVGMVGLVIDGGALIAQQRVAQNGADGTATAGAVVIAESLGGTSHTGAEVKGAIDDMAAANGLGSTTAVYTDDFGVPIGEAVVSSGSIPKAARGVRVQGSRIVDTTFAGVLGINQLTATADATVVAGALSGECVAETDGCAFLPVTFPVKVPTCIDGELQPGGSWIGAPPGTDPGAGYWPLATLADLPSPSNPTGNEAKLAILPLCRSEGDSSGAFGWLDLTSDIPTLAGEIKGPLDFTVNIPDWFHTQPGNPNNVQTELEAWIHKPVLIPLYSGACKVDPGDTDVCPDDKKGQNPNGDGTYYYVQQLNVFYMDRVYVKANNVDECTTGPGYPVVPVDHGTGFLGCMKGWFVDWITAGPIVPGGTIYPGRTAIGIQLVK
jgi:hypothetical protein